MSLKSARKLFKPGSITRRGYHLRMLCPIYQTQFTREICKAKRSKGVETLDHCCSQECSRSLTRQRILKKRSCHQCNDSFLVTNAKLASMKRKGTTHIFCSAGCYAQYRSETFRGAQHHNYNQMELVCTQCKKKFTRQKFSASSNRTKRPFCSTLCYHEWMKGRPSNRTLKTESSILGERSYPYEFKKIRKVLMAVKPQCIVCKKSANTIHHLDEDKYNNDISNLVAVCQGCHLTHHTKSHIPKLLPLSE